MNSGTSFSGEESIMSKITYALVAVALLAMTGCAAIQNSEAISAERSLAAAGFQMKMSTTPAQIAKTAALPQRSLTPTRGPDGQNFFVYADAQHCKCVYVGTEAAYDRYQKLELRQQIAQNEEDASMNWGGWDDWGPWY
jgi:hypothetical protein